MDDLEHRLHWYDWKLGWDDTEVGWYEHTVKVNTLELHKQIIEWIYKNIDKPERHCRWVRIQDELHVRFRYERNYIWFSLTW